MTVEEEAAEAMFKLELTLMRLDYRNDMTSHSLNQHILRVARRFKLETWFVRGLVEEAWKKDTGRGVLSCQVCGLPYARHELGHCPELGGEPVLLDVPSPRTLARRRAREAARVAS